MAFMNKTISNNRPWEHKKWKDGIISPSIIGTYPWNIKSRFRMETMPGVIGGRMCGHLVLPYNIPFDSKLYVRLTNEEKIEHSVYVEGDTSGVVNYLYTHTLIFNNTDIKFIDGNWVVPIEFVIPYNTKGESDNIIGEPNYSDWYFQYRWILRVYTDRKSKSYFNIKFIVPVYRTEESPPTIVNTIKLKGNVHRDVNDLPEHKCIKILCKHGHKSYLIDASPMMDDIISIIKSWCLGYLLINVAILLICCLSFCLFLREDTFGIYLLCFSVFCCILSFFVVGVPMLFDELDTIMSVKETWFFDKCLYQHRTLKAISHNTNFSSWFVKVTVTVILYLFINVRGNSRIITFPYSKIVRFASERSGSRYVVKVYHQATSDCPEKYSSIIADGIITKSEANWLKLELQNHLV